MIDRRSPPWLLLAALAVFGRAPAVEVGSPAPPFEVAALTDKDTVELEAYRGRVVFLDFWASWCAPCRKSLPLYDRMFQELADHGLTVVAVNLDEDPADGARFLDRHPVGYPVASDPAGAVASAYGLKAMPMSYLIDREGTVIEVHLGFRIADMEHLRRRVEEALADDSQ